MDRYGLCVYNLREGVGEHSGWNEGFVTEWMFSLRTDLCIASMFNRSTEELDQKQSEMVSEIFRNEEEDMIGGKSAGEEQ